MKAGDPYIPQNLNDAVNSIITNYQDKGYLKAYVKPKVTENKELFEVNIEMDIVEGNEIKVAFIKFHGNTHFRITNLKGKCPLKKTDFYL